MPLQASGGDVKRQRRCQRAPGEGGEDRGLPCEPVTSLASLPGLRACRGRAAWRRPSRALLRRVRRHLTAHARPAASVPPRCLARAPWTAPLRRRRGRPASWRALATRTCSSSRCVESKGESGAGRWSGAARCRSRARRAWTCRGGSRRARKVRRRRGSAGEGAGLGRAGGDSDSGRSSAQGRHSWMFVWASLLARGRTGRFTVGCGTVRLWRSRRGAGWQSGCAPVVSSGWADGHI